ncbi:MAG: hypothetical protein WC262_12815 [Bacteroidales bacterium]|jgi:hypothetical protein
MCSLDLKHLELWLKDTPSDLAMLSLSEEEYTTLHDAFAILYRQIREVQMRNTPPDEQIRYLETINWLARSRDYGKS